MPWQRWVLSSLLVGALLGSTLQTTHAEVGLLEIGDPAPFSGLLLDKDSSVEVVERLKEGQKNHEVLENLNAIIDSLRKENTALRDAIAEYKQAEAKFLEAQIRADERHKIMTEMDARMAQAIAMNQQALENFARAAQQSQVALEQAHKHIEKLEKYRLIATILGPIGFLAGVFVGIP